MTTEPTTDQAADETGPAIDIDIVVDGRTLDDAEVEALLQKPVDELTDAEREGLQPLYDAAAAQPSHVQVDPLTLAGNLLIGAIEAVNSGNGNDRRLNQTIALGHALAVHAHAAAARMHAQAAQQQLQLMLEARQLAAGKAGGPAASLVVPTIHLGNGRG